MGGHNPNLLDIPVKGNCDPFSKEINTMDTDSKMLLMLELAEENFKEVVLTMLNEVKESTLTVRKKIARSRQRNKTI